MHSKASEQAPKYRRLGLWLPIAWSDTRAGLVRRSTPTTTYRPCRRQGSSLWEACTTNRAQARKRGTTISTEQLRWRMSTRRSASLQPASFALMWLPNTSRKLERPYGWRATSTRMATESIWVFSTTAAIYHSRTMLYPFHAVLTRGAVLRPRIRMRTPIHCIPRSPEQVSLIQERGMLIASRAACGRITISYELLPHVRNTISMDPA